VGSIGGIGTNTVDNNVAWNLMGTNGGVAFNTNPDNAGTGIAAAAVRDSSGLPAAFKTIPWVHTAGNLPVLGGLTGQNGTPPEHLRE
jgi:hypothetical protein